MSCNHVWNRTNAVTTQDGYDTFRCEKCRITGKRFGLDGFILPDTNDNKKSKNLDGITFRRRRGKSIETILREAKKRGNGLEWSKQQYEERTAADTKSSPSES